MFRDVVSHFVLLDLWRPFEEALRVDVTVGCSQTFGHIACLIGALEVECAWNKRLSITHAFESLVSRIQQ